MDVSISLGIAMKDLFPVVFCVLRIQTLLNKCIIEADLFSVFVFDE